MILDQSYHHSAILHLGKSGVGRGRPDIVHFSLLLALGSPLNSDNQLNCFVHTRDDYVITIEPRARLPRNTDRFTALIEQLYQDSVVPSSGLPLMKLRRESLKDLLRKISPDNVVALTTTGSPKPVTMTSLQPCLRAHNCEPMTSGTDLKWPMALDMAAKPGSVPRRLRPSRRTAAGCESQFVGQSLLCVWSPRGFGGYRDSGIRCDGGRFRPADRTEAKAAVIEA